MHFRCETPKATYPSRPTRAPDQAPRPKTQNSCGDGDENVPRLRGHLPFLDHAPKMRQGEQAKHHARRHDVGPHWIASRRSNIALMRDGASAASEDPKAMSESAARACQATRYLDRRCFAAATSFCSCEAVLSV